MPALDVAGAEAAKLARLATAVMAMPTPERERWVAGLNADGLRTLEVALGRAQQLGWRATPATFAHHLDPGFLVHPYVRLLAGKFRDAVEGRSKRQIWNMQARLGKSVTASQWGPLWALDLNPSARFILWSYGKSLAVENALGIRDRITLYGDVLNVHLATGRRRQDRFVTTEGGGVLAAGVSSLVRGFGAGSGGGIVCDDPFKDWQEAHSEARRDFVWNQYRGTLLDRLDDEAAFIIQVHHRVHEDDLTGRLLADAELGGEQWEHVVLPALAVVPDPLGRAEGEPLVPERFSVAFIHGQMRAMGTYLACTPAETPILMADWSERPISQVQVGDHVVGFTAEAGHKVRYQPTVVTAVANRPGLVAEYTMGSGRTVRATRDHRWFVRSGRKYQVAVVGTPLRQVTEVGTEVSDRQAQLWGWLAGMVDGEGHIGRGKVNIVQAVPRNLPVVERLREVLTELGVPYSERHDPSPRPGWSARQSFDLGRSGWVLRMLIEHTALAKRGQAAARLYEGSGRGDRQKDYVLAVQGESAEDVYALQTGTGNYVAWGYASANSALLQQDPSPEEGTELLRAWFQLYGPGRDQLGPAAPDLAITSWDLKLKNKEAGDYVVGQAWWRAGPDYWLRGLLRGQWDHATTGNAIALLAVRHPECRTHIIEAAGSSDEVVPELRKPHPDYEVGDEVAAKLQMTDTERAAVQRLRRRGMSGLVPEPVTDGAKPVRARLFIAPAAEGRNVWLPADASWTPTLLDEIAAFPNGAHDDQVDAMSQALKRLGTGVATVSAAKGRVRKQAPRAAAAGPAPAGRPVAKPTGRVSSAAKRKGQPRGSRLGRILGQ